MSDQLQNIKTKRIFEPVHASDGFRVLVDRLWPRGLRKKDAHIDLWLKDIAPSPELRKWFDHDPSKWTEFQEDYSFELRKGKIIAALMTEFHAHQTITLLYAAKDEIHNNAEALKIIYRQTFHLRPFSIRELKPRCIDIKLKMWRKPQACGYTGHL